jgi:hypothetical protein
VSHIERGATIVLSIRAVSFQGRPIGQELSARFGESGGTIGRGESATLVLPDPERFIHRTHATIAFLAILDPERSEHATARRGHRLCEIKCELDPCFVAALKHESCHREEFARSAKPTEARRGDLETRVPNHAQSVDVSFDPLFQLRKVAERVMRLVGRCVPRGPEERCVLGMLFDDAGAQRRITVTA